MEVWFTEKQTENLSLSCQVSEVLVNKVTSFQEIGIFETPSFGRMLVLDGYIQTTEMDEYLYHEMIAHVPMNTHPDPRYVLVIGGGDGGTVREVLKHPSIEKVTMVEIDREVVEACREYLPVTSQALGNPNVKVEFEDGFQFLNRHPGQFDIVIVDSTEPVGPAAELFGREFYELAYKALAPGGILVAQTESPFYNRDLIVSSHKYLKEFFPVVEMYLAPVPSYPGGLWSFTLASRQNQPTAEEVLQKAKQPDKCKYYSPEVHRGAFILPPFVQEIISQKEE